MHLAFGICIWYIASEADDVILKAKAIEPLSLRDVSAALVGASSHCVRTIGDFISPISALGVTLKHKSVMFL